MESCPSASCSNAQSCATGVGTSGVSSDDAEAQDDDSSSASTIKLELEQFREAWKLELTQKENKSSLAQKNEEKQKEQQASILFMNGVKAEQERDFNEAIYFYRRALRLVPDIESRLSEHFLKGDEANDDDNNQSDEGLSEEEDGEIRNLYEHLQRVQQGCHTICNVGEYRLQEVGSAHISDLPPEVFSYILHWVVSPELDLRSLEQVSMVCRGFYLHARDPEIWRQACFKVWGNCSNQFNTYCTWRDMFIYRPRVCYNGAYISRTTYVRRGDPTFQECFYKPCYLVAYYRYLRFFPSNNVVLMLTTLDDPHHSLSKLRPSDNGSNNAPSLLHGHYNLHGNIITAVLEKPPDINPYLKYRRFRGNQANSDSGHQTYHLELEIRTIKNKFNCQLVWRRYSVHTVFRSGQEMRTNFELTPANFPPFWFSVVRSFTAESRAPLSCCA